MPERIHRRDFLTTAAATTVALGLNSRGWSKGPDGANGQIVIGVMGTGGRGTGLATAFASLPGVKIGYVCDVDKTRVGKAADAVAKVTKGDAPKIVSNYQEILDDKNVDVLVVATCNHWHAPAAIAGCNHGKHVYVEKPCSHNPHEGELLVEASHKHKKYVQMGNQRRSYPKIIEAMQAIREGIIGRVYLAQSWYTNNRPTIGKGVEMPAPKDLDYELWQGPAVRKPFHSNYLHYNWHWFWNWGNGELGNNGIHMIDLCRWALDATYPIRVTSSGGRYRYQDDQETPDTHSVAFEFEGRKTITWEGLSCNMQPAGKHVDCLFYGEKGSLVINGTGYTVYDEKGKELKKETAPATDAMHFGNFLDCVRGAQPRLNSDIEEGHKSTLLCHLGNIAHRTGRTLKCAPTNGNILDDKEASAMWSREYAKGFEPKVT